MSGSLWGSAMHIVAQQILNIRRIKRRVLEYIIKHRFLRVGKNFRFDPYGFYSFGTIVVGNDVYIGPGAVIDVAKGLRIGSKVMIGPNLTVMGGDHRMDVVGKPMFDVRDKRESDDQSVIIEDDVWIGSNVVILKGVVVGAGSVIGAGSIVTRPVPPNSVVHGNASKVVKKRMGDAEFDRHISLIGRGP